MTPASSSREALAAFVLQQEREVFIRVRDGMRDADRLANGSYYALLIATFDSVIGALYDRATELEAKDAVASAEAETVMGDAATRDSPASPTGELLPSNPSPLSAANLLTDAQLQSLLDQYPPNLEDAASQMISDALFELKHRRFRDAAKCFECGAEISRVCLTCNPLSSSEGGGVGEGQRRFRHKARGTTYEIVGDAKLQSAVPAQDNWNCVVYRSLDNGKIWVRPVEEFFDGRFEEIDRAPPPAAPAMEPSWCEVCDAHKTHNEALNCAMLSCPVVSAAEQTAAKAGVNLGGNKLRSPAPTVESAEHPLAEPWRTKSRRLAHVLDYEDRARPIDKEVLDLGDCMSAELTRQFHELQQQAREIELTRQAYRQTFEQFKNAATYGSAQFERAEAAEARCGELEAQLPEGMKNCTIQFKECEHGHGWLTATNWVQHGCPTCECGELGKALEEVRGCFDAAYAEGLIQALSDPEWYHQLPSLFERRLQFAHDAAINALAALDRAAQK